MRNYITITLDKERKLRYSFRVIKQIEDRLQKPFTRVVQDGYLGDWFTVILLGLQGAGEKVTEKQLDELLDFDNLGEIIPSIVEAITGRPAKVDKSDDSPNAETGAGS